MSKPTRFTFDSRDTGDGTPRPGDYIARLDWTGLRVWCGKPGDTCHGEFGTIKERGGGQIRDLVMSDAWRPNERGVWRLIPWAQERYDRGRDPRPRRGQVRNSRDAATGEKDQRAHRINWPVGQFPRVALCPRCGRRNVLQADTLRVMTDGDYMAAYAKMDNA